MIPNFAAVPLRDCPAESTAIDPSTGGSSSDVPLTPPNESVSQAASAIETDESISIRSIYTADDLVGLDHLDSLPGAVPFLRGPHQTMYRERPWTIRQYAGFSTAEDSNAFFRRNVAAGQRGLSVAFDLATHRGYDSDHPRVAGDVGMAGVAIDSIEDMRILFQDIPLDKMSVSMTMNGAVLPIMAMYLVAAEEQGVQASQLMGTIQNDILKEFLVRNTYIYPPEASMRIVADILHYTTERMPRFNSISISGYHMQEAGATADLELAYTLSDGLEYIRAGVNAGLHVDQFCPRFSFFWGVGMDYFMEVAKLRAARLMWAEIVKTFGPNNPKSMCLRAHCQTSGYSLVAQDVYNNAMRTCIEAMAATHGHTQSLHTNAIDEAFALPSDFSARIARNTQLFLQHETDTCKVVDAWGGSYFVERLTRDLVARAQTHIDEIEAAGGMTKAIQLGIPRQRIEQAATRAQMNVESGATAVIGLNRYCLPSQDEFRVRKIDNAAVLQNQVDRLQRLRAERDPVELQQSLAALRHAASGSQTNLLACAVDAARARATVGEISDALESVYGRYSAPARVVRGIYSSGAKHGDDFSAARQRVAEYTNAAGQAPRILVAKMGQDGHDRGQKVIASALADVGFDVEIGPLFQTAEETADAAIKQNVQMIGVSSLTANHLTLVPKLRAELVRRGHSRMMIVVGGVVPPQDHEVLYEAGATAIFGPGTKIADAASVLIEQLESSLADVPHTRADANPVSR
ncbi:methylmalonyl-CoA mutase large subunit [Rhodopirellula maiorica SM1]|uniref:methylmalonyl-CoA mutase n=1 Tax=Rhodopirellula maiorica SM1 TaxID=1265738 RepID=M5RN07_9BACT|nr:methylmalonyl-CoA mutase [Rhodopirellula maiorica]EMI15344.1 methylmalonyl-CoA mutase large subunit [Rhodopirellula maiorica SM1]